MPSGEREHSRVCYVWRCATPQRKATAAKVGERGGIVKMRFPADTPLIGHMGCAGDIVWRIFDNARFIRKERHARIV